MVITADDDTTSKKFIRMSFVSGLISGAINKFLTHPIDTLKARIQINQLKYSSVKNIQKSGIIESAVAIYKAEGIRVFYKGVGIASIMGAPASCLFFGSYESFKYIQHRQNVYSNQMLKDFISGVGAECVSCVLWVPIDVIKERLQVQSALKTYNYTNSIDAVTQIMKGEGIIGLYRAYGATVLAFGPFIGINLMLYEKVKRFLNINRDNSHFTKNFALAFITGTIASLVTNPFDVAKLRMQVQRAEIASQGLQSVVQGRFGYRNVFHGIYRIVNSEGLFALWRGCGARILHMSSQAAVNFSLLDKIRGFLLNASSAK